MSAILKRELSSYFNSAIAYVVFAAYFFFSGLFFHTYCVLFNSASLSYVYADMMMIILFIVPIITMKTFADEKYQKTDQALLTSPVSLFQIVMGKYLGAFLMYAMCSCIFLLYAIVISFFAVPEWSVIICTFIGLLLFGAALVAIDVFISSLTESTIVAAIVSMAVNLVIYMMTSFANIISIDWISWIIEKINFATYYDAFKYGLLNITDIVFFLSVAGLFIFFTVRVLEKRRWS